MIIIKMHGVVTWGPCM